MGAVDSSGALGNVAVGLRGIQREAREREVKNRSKKESWSKRSQCSTPANKDGVQWAIVQVCVRD